MTNLARQIRSTDSPRIDLAFQQLAEQNAYLRTWTTVYWTWYGFFWMLSFVGFFAAVIPIEQKPWTEMTVLGFIFIVLSVQSVWASFRMRRTTIECSARTEAIAEEILRLSGPGDDGLRHLTRATHPGLGTWGAAMSSVSLTLLTLLWAAATLYSAREAGWWILEVDWMVTYLNEHAGPLLAVILVLSAFLSAWANHLIGVYNRPPKQKGLDRPAIRRGHADCWQIACGSNFTLLWTALIAFIIVWIVAGSLSFGTVIAVIVLACYLGSSFYPWLRVAPLRFEPDHAASNRRRVFLASPLGGAIALVYIYAWAAEGLGGHRDR